MIIIAACIQSGAFGFASVAVLMSVVALAYQLKVQRCAMFGARLPDAPARRDEPPFMAAAMVALAIGCVGLSALVVGGLESPFLIGPAARALLGGRYAY